MSSYTIDHKYRSRSIRVNENSWGARIFQFFWAFFAPAGFWPRVDPVLSAFSRNIITLNQKTQVVEINDKRLDHSFRHLSEICN